MIVDINYYQGTYRGLEMGRQEFDKLNSKSEIIIESVTKLNETELLNSEYIDNIKKAICAEIEYLKTHENEINNETTYQSESIGSYSYTTAKGEANIKRIAGLPIAPLALLYLEQVGLLKVGFINVC